MLIFLFTTSIRFLTEKKKKKRIAVFDRYFYDKLANLNPNSSLVKLYWKYFFFFIPKSDVVFFLDTSLKECYKRKPEYSLNFFKRKYKSYQLLKKKGKTINIKTTTINQTQSNIEKILKTKLK